MLSANLQPLEYSDAKIILQNASVSVLYLTEICNTADAVGFYEDVLALEITMRNARFACNQSRTITSRVVNG